MPKKSRCKKLRGSKRMREFGYVQVTVWLDAREHKLVEDAARITLKRVATLIREQAVSACGAIIQVHASEAASTKQPKK